MKKNIAIIIQKLNGGGAERTAANLSLFFADKYNVHLIVFDGSDIKYPYGGTLHDLKLKPSKSKLGKAIVFLKRVAAVKRIKKKFNITTSISLMDGANAVNVFSRRGEKVITSVRNQMSKSRFSSSFSKKCNLFFMKYIEKRSDLIVSLSQGVKDDLVNNFGILEEKVVTIYNPCDGELLAKKALLHKAAAADMPEFSITTMGRCVKQKGQWHLIRAFAKVVEVIPKARLYVLGEGPLFEQLEGLAKDLGVAENIVFPGYVEAPHAFIANSKVFVFPSLFEGLGNVILEAMACGTPCVCADCFSGPREIIAPKTPVREKLTEIEYAQYGILTSVGGEDILPANVPLSSDEEQLTKAIIQLLQDEELRQKYSRASLERSKDFLPSVIMEQWDLVL